MSDSALKTAKYSAYTTTELQNFIIVGRGNAAMIQEIERRVKVESGDWSAMTHSEKLRRLRI